MIQTKEIASPEDESRALLRKLKIVLGFLVSSLVALEIALMFIWPRTYRITYLDGESPVIRDDKLAYAYRPNASWIEEKPEFKVRYQINEQGMRDRFTHDLSKPADVTRILVLGDSFTFGAGNDYEKIWPVIFEHNLLKAGYRVDVIKAGAYTHDTYTEFLQLKQLYPRFKPDVVVVAFQSNDLLTSRPKPGETPSGSLEMGVAAPAASVRRQKFRIITLLRRLIKKNDLIYSQYNLVRGWGKIFSSGDFQTQQIKDLKEVFLEINSYANEHNVRLIFVSIPEFSQVIVKARKYSFPNIDVDVFDEEFQSLATAYDFGWLATLPGMAQKYASDHEDLYFRLDEHLNNAGNQYIADFLFGHIIQILPARSARSKL